MEALTIFLTQKHHEGCTKRQKGFGFLPPEVSRNSNHVLSTADMILEGKSAEARTYKSHGAAHVRS